MQCFLVGYRGKCHLYFVRIHTRLKARVYTENTSDAWHIPRYPTRKHCITSMYCIVLYCTVLYCIVLYCIVLYCIVLYCIEQPTNYSISW